MYFITTKRMLEVCFSAHPNIQYRTFIKNKDRVILFSGTMDFLEQHIEIDVFICFKKLYIIFDVKLLCIEN